jgi:hypothetical protein
MASGSSSQQTLRVTSVRQISSSCSPSNR